MKYALLLILLLAPLRALAAVSEWVDFTLHNGHVYLPIVVEGIETHVLLDSGSQVHAINKAFVGKHNLDLATGAKMRIQGVHDTEDRTTYNNVEVGLFGSEFELDKVVEFNLGHHSSGMLLGAAFLTRLSFRLTTPKRKFAYSPATAWI